MQNKDTNDRQKIIKELLDVTDTEIGRASCRERV